jgi:type I restriction enzyme R subunit
VIGTEAPVQAKIVEYLAGLGWRPVAQKEMTALRSGRMGEPLVEPLLVDALRQLNEGLSEQEALQVVDRLRRITESEPFLEVVRDGLNLALTADEPARRITIVDWNEPSRNVFVVTTEFELRTGAVREPRLDVVCLVNGIPLGLVETKAPTDDWKKAARDFKQYWKDAPELEKYAAVCVATNGFRFRCAPSGASKTSQYAEWKDSWPQPMPEEDRELEIGLLGLLDTPTLVDVAANFVVFETRRGETTKRLARYQQYRGANKVVQRVLEGTYDRGIVWHTQGSGKSLTMLFAARKLIAVGLGNPTIFIVIDRVDLDDQINETFTAASFEGVRRATTRARLRDMLADDERGVIITTVEKFDESMEALVERESVIVLVDEAHRSQEGLFGIRMRAALPNAKLFAFTGTPIETTDRSTRRAFSPEIKGADGSKQYENYLDIYTPKEAVDDGATVEVRYEFRGDEWGFKGDELDRAFEAFAEDEGLSEEERERLKSDAARLAVVAKADKRVKAIATDALGYLRSHTEPQGFKAQLVCVDREACALYAEELLRLGLEPDELAVVFTPNAKHDDDSFRRWWASEQWRRVHGKPAEQDEVVVAEGSDELAIAEAKAKKSLIDEFKHPSTRLKLLIVCDMLLTGFDAPVEQVMFLDKPLKGAKLLQAIMRTNRPYPAKDRGIIVDYAGVFDRLQEAFAEFSPEEVDLAVLDLATLRDRFPVLVEEALALVAGRPSADDEYELMMWLVRRFRDEPKDRELFEERFQAVQSAYESLAPDPALAPYLDDYSKLVRLRALWRHGSRQDEADSDFDLEDYRPQTHALVREAVSIERLRDDVPVYRIDGSYVGRIQEGPGSAEEKAAEVEEAIEYEIRRRGEDDPVARSLAERLEKLRRRREEAQLDMLKQLEEALQLVEEFVDEQEAREALGLSERAQGFLALAKTNAPALDDERAFELAAEIDKVVERNATFPEWAERDDVLRDIRLELIRLLAHEPDTQTLVKADAGFVDALLSVAVAREAAEA